MEKPTVLCLNRMSLPNEKTAISIRRYLATGMVLAVTVVLESMLAMIPNVQLTVVLIAVYAMTETLGMSITFVSAYVLLDSVLAGSFNPLYVLPALIAWLLFAIVMHALRNRKLVVIVIAATLFGFVYGWFYLPARMLEYGIGIFWPYLVADLPFEVLMAVNNLITVAIALKPLRALMDTYYLKTSPHS